MLRTGEVIVRLASDFFGQEEEVLRTCFRVDRQQPCLRTPDMVHGRL